MSSKWSSRWVSPFSHALVCSPMLQVIIDSMRHTVWMPTTTRKVKLVSLENRYDKLSDDLWGEETGTSRIMQARSGVLSFVQLVRQD